MNQLFNELYSTIWNQVFPKHPPLEIEVVKKLFTKDLILPELYSTHQTKSTVYSSPEYGYKKFISQEEAEKRSSIDNFMEVSKSLSNLSEVLQHVQTIALFRASRAINSEVLEESDDIYSSSYIYNSTHIYNCQKLMFCNNNKTSEYLIASKGNADSSFGIRLVDSTSISNSFDIHWSGKCAHSYFCVDSYDLRDCMFCFHLTSKQFCIGNIQYTEAEYKKLKDTILKEYFEQLSSPNSFVLLNQL
jgi:hypothetical protein